MTFFLLVFWKAHLIIGALPWARCQQLHHLYHRAGNPMRPQHFNGFFSSGLPDHRKGYRYWSNGFGRSFLLIIPVVVVVVVVVVVGWWCCCDCCCGCGCCLVLMVGSWSGRTCANEGGIVSAIVQLTRFTSCVLKKHETKLDALTGYSWS